MAKGRSLQVIDRSDLDKLFDALKSRGYQLIGPTVRDQAIVYDELQSTSDLPQGWTDQHDGGHYRLIPRRDQALFGYVVGPQSWKKYLFPAHQRLFRANQQDGSLHIQPEQADAPKRAFIGARSCELAAVGVQDRVFAQAPFLDTQYQARRTNLFWLAVNCTEPGGTCFCTSMDTGPQAKGGFDLALTEVLGDGQHYFLVETGSDTGAQVLADTPARPARKGEVQAARDLMHQARNSMGRELDTTDIRDLLVRNREHPRWEAVAQRCLSCANCTLVCPTCFCSSVEDHTSLDGGEAERSRHWDSCFNLAFSYLVGGPVRGSTAARYRQWLTHKLGTWHDQFGTSGCVGCGRCITWCPVGIDITEEARAIRATDGERQP